MTHFSYQAGAPEGYSLKEVSRNRDAERIKFSLVDDLGSPLSAFSALRGRGGKKQKTLFPEMKRSPNDTQYLS